MKLAGRKREYSLIPRVLWLAVPLLGLQAGCTSTAPGDAAPAAAPAARPAAEAPRRPTQPDGYPNINIGAEAASPQFSESDRQRLAHELEDLRRRQAPGAETTRGLSEEERLRLLARSHGERVLNEIEASQQ